MNWSITLLTFAGLWMGGGIVISNMKEYKKQKKSDRFSIIRGWLVWSAVVALGVGLL